MSDINIKNKNILITGINGFVGKHLNKRLSSLGANVFGISTKVDNKNISKVNILDYESLEKVVQERRIQICYHLAGESLVESGQNDPLNTFKVNIDGTLNILEIARKNNLEKVIIASTSHVYGRNKVPYLESYTPRPSRSYETSKACTDLIAQSYSETFNLPVLIPRFVNIYGPGDLNFTRLIPKTIRAILLGTPTKMWGGEALREYLFIDDAIDAYLKLASLDLDLIGENKIFNFGSGNIISVSELIKKIIKLSKKRITIKKIARGRTLEIEEQYVSFEKAKRMLKWRPKTSLDEGLRKTIVWYTKNV